MFRCRPFGAQEELFLSEDMSVRCFEGKHQHYTGIAILFATLYILGIPMVFLGFLRLHKSTILSSAGLLEGHYSSTKEQVVAYESVKARFGQIFAAYNPDGKTHSF